MLAIAGKQYTDVRIGDGPGKTPYAQVGTFTAQPFPSFPPSLHL